jgi:hypothetical protein
MQQVKLNEQIEAPSYLQEEIEIEVVYNIVSLVSYVGEEAQGEHKFSIQRHWVDLVFDDEEATAFVNINKLNSKGKVEVEAYDGDYIREEEERAIDKILGEILLKK